MRSKLCRRLFTGSLVWLLAAPTLSDEPAAIDRLRWLAGCWEQKEGDRSAVEHWFAPAGGAMIGGSHTVAGGRMVTYEFLRIVEREGKLAYISIPAGQVETVFALVEQTDTSALFANPEHDFPQRVRYRLVNESSLEAQIEGGEGAAEKIIRFPMRRVSCEPLMR